MTERSKVKAARSETPSDEPASAGSQQSFERLLPQARAIPRAEVRAFRADVPLALTNAKRGVDSVLAEAARIEKELPQTSLPAIRGLGDLGLALAFAAGQVERFAPPEKEVKKLLAQAHDLRAILLSSADSLAMAGVLSAAAVAKIREGHGGIDAAGDCIALAALFQKNAAAVRGKTPVTADQVRQAAEVGTNLIAVLQPKGAKKKGATGGLVAAVNDRNRFWTLFEKTWEDEVWRTGAWIFGRAGVDANVPPLQSRVGKKRGAKGGTAVVKREGA